MPWNGGRPQTGKFCSDSPGRSDLEQQLVQTSGMARRTLLGCLAILALCAPTACKDQDQGWAAVTQTSAEELDKRCERLARVCGDKAKHVEKITAECKQTAKTQVEHGCTDKALAVYACYEMALCATSDKVWALEDLRVLAERNSKCVAERAAISDCAKK